MVSKSGRYIFAVILLSFFLTGCGGKKDKGVISEKELVALLTDLEIAEAYTTSSGSITSVQSRSIGEGVLKAHGVTREQLDSTLSWYGRNADLYYELLKKVDKNIEKKQQLLARQQGAVDEKGDKSDLWRGLRGVRISENTLRKGIVFDISSPEIEKGDVLEWCFRTSGEVNANALLGVDYADGTSHSQRIPRYGDRRFSLKLQTDSSKTVKRIFGYFQETDASALPVWCDSIRLLRHALDTFSYNEISRQRFLGVPAQRKVSINDTIKTETSDGTLNGEPNMREKAINRSGAGVYGSQGRSDVSPSKLIEQSTGNKDEVDKGLQNNKKTNGLRK